MASFKNLSPIAKSGILLVSGISIFGFADNLTLLVSDDVSVGQFHFSRSLCASTIVLLFAYFTGANIIPKKWLAIIIRTFLNVIAMILYFSVIPIMPIAEAGAGLFTAPIFVLIISGVFFRVVGSLSRCVCGSEKCGLESLFVMNQAHGPLPAEAEKVIN